MLNIYFILFWKTCCVLAFTFRLLYLASSGALVLVFQDGSFRECKCFTECRSISLLPLFVEEMKKIDHTIQNTGHFTNRHHVALRWYLSRNTGDMRTWLTKGRNRYKKEKKRIGKSFPVAFTFPLGEKESLMPHFKRKLALVLHIFGNVLVDRWPFLIDTRFIYSSSCSCVGENKKPYLIVLSLVFWLWNDVAVSTGRGFTRSVCH